MAKKSYVIVDRYAPAVHYFLVRSDLPRATLQGIIDDVCQIDGYTDVELRNALTRADIEFEVLDECGSVLYF